MEGAAMLRAQMKGAHDILEGTMRDVTQEQASWAPPGIANPLGATYAHLAMGEDMLMHGMVMSGKPPLFATSWAGKIGVSEMPPSPAEGTLDKWSRSVKVDLTPLREYAKAVYAATDEYLASLDDIALDKPLDMSRFGLGQQTVGFFLGNILVGHINNHCGEIACLKGLQGAKGYPF